MFCVMGKCVFNGICLSQPQQFSVLELLYEPVSSGNYLQQELLQYIQWELLVAAVKTVFGLLESPQALHRKSPFSK